MGEPRKHLGWAPVGAGLQMGAGPQVGAGLQVGAGFLWGLGSWWGLGPRWGLGSRWGRGSCGGGAPGGGGAPVGAGLLCGLLSCRSAAPGEEWLGDLCAAGPPSEVSGEVPRLDPQHRACCLVTLFRREFPHEGSLRPGVPGLQNPSFTEVGLLCPHQKEAALARSSPARPHVTPGALIHIGAGARSE